MNATIKANATQTLKNCKLYKLVITNNANETVLELDNIDLMGAIRVSKDRSCKMIQIYE